MSTVGERIKKLRKKQGISADDLAKRINKSRATIYRYENGEIENAPYTILEPLAIALDTTPGYLLGLKEEIYDIFVNEKLNVSDVKLNRNYITSDIELEIIEMYRKLSDEQRKAIYNMLLSMVEK